MPKGFPGTRTCQNCGEAISLELGHNYCPFCGQGQGKPEKRKSEVKIKDAHVSTITLTTSGDMIKFQYENGEIGLYTEIRKADFWNAVGRLQR